MTIESLGILGLFISAFISATIAPGGSEVILAYMVNSHQYDMAWLVAVATLGNSLGAMTTWWLGFWTSKKYPAENMLPVKHQKSLRTVKDWGSWALLLSWLPIVGDGLCFAGGWLRLSLISSVLAIFLGKTLRYIVVVYAFV